MTISLNAYWTIDNTTFRNEIPNIQQTRWISIPASASFSEMDVSNQHLEKWQPQKRTMYSGVIPYLLYTCTSTCKSAVKKGYSWFCHFKILNIKPLVHTATNWQRIKFSLFIVYLPLPFSNFMLYMFIWTLYLGLIYQKYLRW